MCVSPAVMAFTCHKRPDNEFRTIKGASDEGLRGTQKKKKKKSSSVHFNQQ